MKPAIKAFVFDVYGTLFDVHSVTAACEKQFPGLGVQISQAWRKKQIEYLFLRQLMERYRPFDQVTREALRFTVKEHQENLSDLQEQQLIEEYHRLTPFNEVEDVLKALSGNQLIILSNGTSDMLASLIKRANFTSYFTSILSVDKIKQYKPVPASYNLVLEDVDAAPEEVLFMSSNGWDITGAKSFGFQTAWINRSGLPKEELGFTPDIIYSDLTGMLEWNN
ncbi:haloacid dehalogenase type II [Jeotgalibacillus proteolyticus]|uniref:Haloacid dehalogenase type II n=1 Tax=Jeotgalibacillus proteolyticus TaxID=2082395 RepID=A0A2S5GD85_9BACL|nr:haloacid dehalogenase type II [Jeotgalibacillus proteolyticus]PPA70918.1 haloacid dehalogenase type II [Jeotgalibacillus proteolyticus]